MRTPGLFAVALSALPGLAAAQAVNTLGPGDSQLDGKRIKPGRWKLEMMVTRDGQTQSSMHGEQEIRRVIIDGKPALELVQVFHSPRGTRTDTTRILAAGLTPISHRSYGMGASKELNFTGRIVSGSMASNGVSSVPFRKETEQPTFDSAALELVIAAAPLGAGFRARMPMYVHEQNGLVWHDIAVTGEESVDASGSAIPVWRVEVKT
ncbi:MAG: hypothetical protein ACREMA_01850, partial [Longimicrobiales bacterium]